jgi:hypothetical protein
VNLVGDDVRKIIDIKSGLKTDNRTSASAQDGYVDFFKSGSGKLHKAIDTPTSLFELAALHPSINLVAPKPQLSSLSQRKVSRLILGNLI